jgi:hypothetical protein
MTDDRDLVIRLREYRMDVDSPDVVYEAADEIERLRALLRTGRGTRKGKNATPARPPSDGLPGPLPQAIALGNLSINSK